LPDLRVGGQVACDDDAVYVHLRLMSSVQPRS
jgi:hypothetical protein